MKRRCNIERNPVLRGKVHELVRQGATVARIAEQVGAAASRPTVGRYVRRYNRLLAQVADWSAQAELDVAMQGSRSDAIRQTRQEANAICSLMRRLDRRDLEFKEAAVRESLGGVASKLKPKGATPAAINFVKSKLLGLDVDQPHEALERS